MLMLKSVRRSRLLCSLLMSAAAAAGCSDDKKKSDTSVVDAGDADAGTQSFEGCDTVIEASWDTEAIQEALIEAKTKSVVCFANGTYALDKELSVGVNDLTVRGNPDDREAVVLDFAEQELGDDAISVSSDGFTIEHLTVKNTKGNSIIVQGVDRVTFRSLKVSWDAGSTTKNGAYAVYPVQCTNVLVEDCEVVGASDAGIYVGQSKNVIVRNNQVHGNVAGIEIENTDDAEVVGNHTYDNTAGIMVFTLANKVKKDGFRCLVHDNLIEDNNRENFAESGTTVSFVPAGLGVMVLAADETEIRDNELKNNGSTAVLTLSTQTFNLICQAGGGTDCSAADDGTDPDVSKTYIHDNEFSDNGKDPAGAVKDLIGETVESVLWDGRTPVDAPELQFCVDANIPSLRVFGSNEGFNPFKRDNDITDIAPYVCTLPAPFEKITLPQDD